MRRLDELEACKKAGIFDAILWVDRSQHLQPEEGSMDITMDNCGFDFIVDNNGSLKNLQIEINSVLNMILGEFDE